MQSMRAIVFGATGSRWTARFADHGAETDRSPWTAAVLRAADRRAVAARRPGTGAVAR